MRKKYVKALGGLLGIMLFFTVVSRVTASFTVPQVITEQPSQRTITHVVTMQGSVEGVLETAVLTEPGLLVEHVYVEPGQQIEEGEVLAVLNEEQIAERIRQQQEEIQILKLSNETQNQEDNNRARTRAAEDYDYAVRAAKQQVERAAEQLENAKTAYDRAQWAEVPPTEEQYAALLSAVQAAQAAYDAALLQQEQSVRAAARVVEDANKTTEVSNQIQINQIRITQKEREIAPLLALQEAECKIVSPISGVVTEVALVTGQKTTDTAAVLVMDTTAGLRCVAKLVGEDADGVSVGDDVTLIKNTARREGFVVTAVESKPDGSTLITVFLGDLGDSCRLGETIQLEIEKGSTSGKITLPVTALHEQNGRYYVYVLQEAQTVLGEEYQAVRIDVTVMDRNDRYAALQEGVISDSTPVIVDSDRYVEAGDVVRLQTE